MRPAVLPILIALIALIALLAVAVPAHAGDRLHTRQLDPGADSPPAALEDLAWLAGHWRGQAMGGVVEELWSPPRADSMMGSFRLQVGEATKFYELMIIRRVRDTLLLQLKHFHGDLTGWEEREETVDFRLVAVNEGIALFEGFTIQRVSEDRLDIWVLVGEGDAARETLFAYHRVQSP
jgi:hypothetical protein